MRALLRLVIPRGIFLVSVAKVPVSKEDNNGTIAASTSSTPSVFPLLYRNISLGSHMIIGGKTSITCSQSMMHPMSI